MQQGAGQAEPLRHAPREAGHQRVALVGQVDQLEDLLADLPPRRPLDAVGRGEELEVLDHLHVVVDAEEVGHVPDHAADLLRPGVDRVAADRRLAPRGVQERGEDPHRRRLAGAVGADEAVDVPLVERQVEPVERVELAVHLGQIIGLDHRGGPRVVSGSPAAGRRRAEEPVDAVWTHGFAADSTLSGRMTRSSVVRTTFGGDGALSRMSRDPGRATRATSIGRGMTS